MKALVLDLRDNPGGLLESGVGVARYLVPKGPIVSVTDKDGNTQTESSSLETVDFPLAVLVNMVRPVRRKSYPEPSRIPVPENSSG